MTNAVSESPKLLRAMFSGKNGPLSTKNAYFWEINL
jgi:hypothetical protein